MSAVDQATLAAVEQREHSYARLTRENRQPTRDEIAALKELLTEENLLIRSVLAQSNGKSGVSEVLGEGYSEYYSSLFQTVLGFAKDNNIEVVSVLAGGAFDPRSSAATIILQYPTIALPIFLKDSTLHSSLVKAKAIEMIGRVSLIGRSQLTSVDQRNINDALVAALGDRNPVVRTAAIRAVGEAQIVGLAPLLKEIAKSDKESRRVNGKNTFPIREEALHIERQLELQN